jgi:glyceraldehyde 3-phosphate dehydrogenase
VSIVDLVVEVEKSTSREDVNAALKKASQGALEGILGFCEEPLVSMDFKGDARSSIVDSDYTMVFGGTMVKVLAWYDNEWAYSVRITDLAKVMADRGL